MINISTDTAEKITASLDETEEVIPSKLHPVVSLLRSQLTQLKCDEGLLVDCITLLQNYYTSCVSKNDSPLKKDEKKEEGDKLRDLIIALHQIQQSEMQSHSLRKRR